MSQELDVLTRPERRAQLELDAVEVLKNESYLKNFSEEEFAEKKMETASRAMEIASITQQIKNLTDDLAARKRELAKEQKEAIEALNFGGEYTTGDLYLIPDNDKHIMRQLDEDGNEISSRPFNAKERQLLRDGSY